MQLSTDTWGIAPHAFAPCHRSIVSCLCAVVAPDLGHAEPPLHPIVVTPKPVTIGRCYHKALLPQGCVTTRRCYHEALLQSGCVTTRLRYHQAWLPQGLVVRMPGGNEALFTKMLLTQATDMASALQVLARFHFYP